MTRWARHRKRREEAGSKWENLNDSRQRKTQQSSSAVAQKSKLTSDLQLEAVKKIALKKNKRSENRRLKRQRRKESNKVCFHCRMPGHGMADCPTLRKDNEQGTGICFKCGSTEHSSHTCTARVDAGKEFMFAKCFICGEEGHLSKSCPDNPRGLYPNGGCCKLCGSVDHYKKDCPERPVKGDVAVYSNTSGNTATLHMASHVSIDDEVGLYEDEPEPKVKPPKKKPKVVHF